MRTKDCKRQLTWTIWSSLDSNPILYTFYYLRSPSVPQTVFLYVCACSVTTSVLVLCMFTYAVCPCVYFPMGSLLIQPCQYVSCLSACMRVFCNNFCPVFVCVHVCYLSIRILSHGFSTHSSVRLHFSPYTAPFESLYSLVIAFAF
jgi:hypothetical protein